MTCLHANYNDYFEKCDDCGGDEEQVIREHLLGRLEEIIADEFEVTGAHNQLCTLEELGNILAGKAILAKAVATAITECKARELLS